MSKPPKTPADKSQGATPEYAEIWKPIPATPGYEASTLGRIRSYRMVNRGRSMRPSNVLPRILKPQTVTNGTQTVTLSTPHGSFSENIAELVLLTFRGNCPNEELGWGPSHKDGDLGNNRLDNLCYEGRVMRDIRAKLHGRRHPTMSKAERVRVEAEICKMYLAGTPVAKILVLTGCNSLYRVLHKHNIPLRRK